MRPSQPTAEKKNTQRTHTHLPMLRPRGDTHPSTNDPLVGTSHTPHLTAGGLEIQQCMDYLVSVTISATEMCLLSTLRQQRHTQIDIISIRARKGPTVDRLLNYDFGMQQRHTTKPQIKSSKWWSTIDLSARKQGWGFVEFPFPTAWHIQAMISFLSTNRQKRRRAQEFGHSIPAAPVRTAWRGTMPRYLYWVLFWEWKVWHSHSPGLTGSEVQLRYSKTGQRSQIRMPAGTT